MDLRAILGLALIATAVVMGSLLLVSDARGVSRFFSLPRRKADWLRLLLGAVAAYVVTVLLLHRFGYALPLLRGLDPGIAWTYPLALLAAGSLIALFVERRSGIVFSVISVLMILVVALDPAYA